MLIKGKTSSGFKYQLDENKLNDWRVVKLLAKMTKLTSAEDSALDFILIMSEIEELIFDDKGEAFERHILESNSGTIAPAVALSELVEILKANKESKN